MGARTLAAVLLLAAATASAGALANQNQERRERDEQRNDRGGLEETKTVHAITFVDGSGQVNITSVIVISNTGAVLGALTGSGVRQVDEDRFDLGGVPLIGGLFGDDEDDYDDEDGPPRVRIGYAYLVGNNLTVDLSQPVQPGSAHASKLRLKDIEEGLKPTSAIIEARIMEVSNPTASELGIDYGWQDRRLELDAFKLLHTSYSYQMSATQFLNIGYTDDASAGTESSGGGKVPVLGDIPLVGDLFRHRAGDAYLEGRNLIVLVRPSILEDDYE